VSYDFLKFFFFCWLGVCRLVHTWETGAHQQCPSWPGHKGSVNEVRIRETACKTMFKSASFEIMCAMLCLIVLL
jgi:hypothetical protein